MVTWCSSLYFNAGKRRVHGAAQGPARGGAEVRTGLGHWSDARSPPGSCVRCEGGVGLQQGTYSTWGIFLCWGCNLITFLS